MNLLSQSLLVLSIFYSSDFSSCGRSSEAGEIRCVKVTTVLPIVDLDGTIGEYKTTLNLYYYKDIIMYGYTYLYDSTENGKRIIDKEERNGYFVYQKDSLFGYNYDPKNEMENSKRLPVDSMIRGKIPENRTLDSFSNIKPDSSSFNKQEQLYRELYKRRGKGTDTSIYILEFFYSKRLSDLKESFNRSLDSARKMKLSKIRMIFPEGYSNEYKMTFPKREAIAEMVEVPVRKADEILSYFNKYMRMQKSRRNT